MEAVTTAPATFPIIRSESPPPGQEKEGSSNITEQLIDSPRCAGSFPRSLSSPGAISSSKYHELSDKPDLSEAASHYRRMLQAGVDGTAVRYRMHLDGADTNKKLVKAVFGAGGGAVDDFYTNLCVKEENRLGFHLLRNAPPFVDSTTKGPSWKNTTSETKHLIALWQERPPRHPEATIELLDLKRAGKIMVALRAFSDMTHAELAEAIDCVEQIHGSERVRLLEEILPTEAERDLIRAYCGRVKDLAPCSQWLKRLVAVPNYEAKVKVIQTVETFTAQVDRMSEQFQLVERVSDQMMDSAKLKKLLVFVLSVGKILKKGCTLGNASVFEVGTLSRLAQTKSKDGKMTVMEFMVRCVASRKRYALNVMQDFPECEAASKVDIPNLLFEMSKLYKSLEICKEELKRMKLDEMATTHWLESAEYPLRHGIKRLERFLSYASVCFSKMEVHCDLALAACRKLSRFCGVMSGQNTTACLSVVTQFAKDVERASQEYDNGYELDAAPDRGSPNNEFQVYMIQSRNSGPSLRRHQSEQDAKKARALFVRVIGMGPKLHEPLEKDSMLDESHLHHVKSLVGLYSELIKPKVMSGKHQGVSDVEVHLEEIGSAGPKELDQVHVNAWDEVSQNEIRQDDQVFQVGCRVDQPTKVKGTTSARDLPAGMPATRSADHEPVFATTATVDETHIHHVKSLVGLFSEDFEPKLKDFEC